MLTGIIISYDGTQGQIRTNTGIQYSFSAKQVKSPGDWRPKAKEAVILKLQDGQQSVVRSVRQLPPGHLKASNPNRVIPARYVGWGIAVSRFAPGIELTAHLRTHHKVVPGSIVLVPYEVTGNTLATATGVTVVQKGSEQQQALAGAMFADEKEVEAGKAELLGLLAALGEVGTAEQYERLKSLLLRWDAYTSELLPFRATLQGEWVKKLAEDGYAHCLGEEELVRAQEQGVDVALLRNAMRQLPAAVLKRIVLEQLASLSAETPIPAYRQIGQWLKAAPELVQAEKMLQPPALSQLPLPEVVRLNWWEEDLVEMPAERMLISEMSRRLQLMQADPKADLYLRCLVAACQRSNCLEQIGGKLLAAMPVEDRMVALRGLMPVVDAATSIEWAQKLLVGQLADDELYAAWERNELLWLPAELVARQLLTKTAATVMPALKRLEQLPGAAEALAQAAPQGLYTTVKMVLQALHTAAWPPAPTPYVWIQSKPTIVLTSAWAKETLLALQQSLMELPDATRVAWWLEGLMPEPSPVVLLVHCLGEGGNQQEAGWRKLSESGATALEEVVVPWLEQAQPVAWVQQAQQYWAGQPHLTRLRQRVLAVIGTHWPATAQVELWLQEGSEQPSVATLIAVLPDALPDRMRAILTRAKADTLPGLLEHYLASRPVGPSPELALGLEIAVKKLGTNSKLQAWYGRLVEVIKLELTPAQYDDYWQLQLLPSPGVELLQNIVEAKPVADWTILFQRCSLNLLQAYAPTVVAAAATSSNKEELTKALLEALSKWPSYEVGVADLRNQLFGGLSDDQQLRLWLDNISGVSPAWEVIARGLTAEDESWWRQIAEKATRYRLSEMLDYLPTADVRLFAAVAELLCRRKILGGQYASLRVPSLVKFAEVVTERLSHEPTLIFPWLRSILQQCQSPNPAWASSRYAATENRGRVRIREVVHERVAPHLSATEQLRWWASNLVLEHPAVAQSDLVEFVVRDMQEAEAARVAVAYTIPEVVVRAWRELGNLRAALFEQQFLTIKTLLPEAARFPDLLLAVDPYLDADLTSIQRATLWLYGYPTELAAGGGWWTIPERMQGVIRLHSLGRDVAPAPWLAPTAEEIEEWLAEQYWKEEDQQLASQAYTLLRDYHTLAVVELPAWEELESEFLVRCAGVVKVRLWMTLPPKSQQRTFNYYTFRRGYSRLRAAEQREFLRKGQPYLLQAGKTDQDFKGALHLRRRRLVRQQDGVSVYRVSLAHCYCPEDGQLEVELADHGQTRPCAYPGAEDSWNDKFYREPWAGCPVLAYVDDQTLELLKIQGLEAALAQYPLDQQPKVRYVFRRERAQHGTTGNPVGYWEDEALHDELSSYLLDLTSNSPVAAVALIERPAERGSQPGVSRASNNQVSSEPENNQGSEEAIDDLALGAIIQPRQTVLYTCPLQEEVVFVWAPQFSNTNRATYVFRVPLAEQQQALERLTDLLQLVSNIRSALLAPGLASHRLRRYLGYVCTIRGQRGHGQAFERWQHRLDSAIADGPSRQHPYDPDSDFQPEELHGDQDPMPAKAYAAPKTTTAQETEVSPERQAATVWQAKARQHLQQLRQLNEFFLSGYSA